MKKILLILFTICIITQSAYAQTNVGSAEFGMQSTAWPCQTARASENQIGLTKLRKAVLWNTFGTHTSCIEEYLADPRLVSFEVHLINEVCQRSNNCGDYEFAYGMSAEEYNIKMTNKAPALVKKLKAYLEAPSKLINSKLQSHTECLISPGLESNLSTEAAKNLIAIVRPFFPKCKIVWNPVGNSPVSKPIAGTIFESHGANPKMSSPCNANLDGVDINFPTRPAILPEYIENNKVHEYFNRYKTCQNSFLWIAEFNGITSGDFVDPRKRTAFPSLETFNLVNKLLLP